MGEKRYCSLYFAGASAEFALNKAVDWLYFTGRLPADPLGRLFSTVSYARQIVFLKKDCSHTGYCKIAGIHAAVEKQECKNSCLGVSRCAFMLIGYSISSFELLERKLSAAEKKRCSGFYKVGKV